MNEQNRALFLNSFIHLISNERYLWLETRAFTFKYMVPYFIAPAEALNKARGAKPASDIQVTVTENNLELDI